MSGLFGREELENLKSLKKDLVDPVRSFAEEVRDDTLGDAGRFYAQRAKRAGARVRAARERAELRRESARLEQELRRRQRRAKMKKAAIVLAVIAVAALLIVSAALNYRF